MITTGGNNDYVSGNDGNDQLNGGDGRDMMTGGDGSDTFVFNAAGETTDTGSNRDRIRDFSQTEGDLIDLSGIDAATAPGDQMFTFIGTSAFSGAEGELQFVQNISNNRTKAYPL